VKKIQVLSAKCFLLRDEDFSCCMDVLYEGLGISKLQFLIKKYEFYFSCKFFPMFGHQNLGFGSGSALTKNGGSVSGSASAKLIRGMLNRLRAVSIFSYLYGVTWK
jgi:hypothetical protein